MPAVPALVMAGGAIGGSLLGNKTAKDVAAGTPQQQALMASQTKLADQTADQGRQEFSTAMPAIKNTLNYYGTLLNGNRGARMAAISPEAQDTGAAYGGAETAIKGGPLRGGERDQALAANATARSGAIARLVTGVRPGAAAAIAGEGGNLLNTAGGSNATAGGIYGRLTGAAGDQQQRGLNAGATTSGNFGALLANLLNQYKKSPGSGGGPSSLLPSTQSYGSFAGPIGG